ncbi:MAG: hypothetical protein OEZ65_13915 [Gemmatimonadota bacterium]|nr:hypothetical protein [Gemmatimonadota bacterium]MDH5760680.1 hypothetical protein [Gemmatimonadota bacterium]
MAEPEVVANIGPRGRRARLRGGLRVGAAGALLVGALSIAGVDPLWRLTALPLFWLASLGVIQAREKT